MKVIIAGPRYKDPINKIKFDDYQLVERAITESGFDITEEVCGMAVGVDLLGKQWAESHGIPVKPFPADWDIFGMAAGHIRNRAMAEYADAAIIVWDNKSKGTKNMIEEMIRVNKPYTVILTDGEQYAY